MVRPCVAAGNSPMNKKLNQNKWIESCRNWKIMKNLWVRKPPQQHVSALQGARDAPLETEAPCFGRGDSKKHYIASQESEHKDDIDSMVPEWSQDGPRMVPGLGPPALQGKHLSISSHEDWCDGSRPAACMTTEYLQPRQWRWVNDLLVARLSGHYFFQMSPGLSRARRSWIQFNFFWAMPMLWLMSGSAWLSCAKWRSPNLIPKNEFAILLGVVKWLSIKPNHPN